jgi:protein gp37
MTKIQWTGKTWNPVVGCSVHSPGCTHCYAMRVARRLSRIALTREKYSGLTIDTKAGPVWNGKLRLWEPELDAPLHWHKPTLIFPVSEGDIAHQDMPVEWFARIWETMLSAHRQRGHVFQVLTKRPDHLLRLLAAIGVTAAEPGIWLGVSAEDARRWDARAPLLHRLPTEVRWISVEPQLDRIDRDVAGIDWIVQGGESGRAARDFDLDWARVMRDRRCRKDGTPYFLKQIGQRAFDNGQPFRTKHAKGGNPAEWPADLRVRQWPEARR